MFSKDLSDKLFWTCSFCKLSCENLAFLGLILSLPNWTGIYLEPVGRFYFPPLVDTPSSAAIVLRVSEVTFPLVLRELLLTNPAKLVCFETLLQIWDFPLFINEKHLEHTCKVLAGEAATLLRESPSGFEWAAANSSYFCLRDNLAIEQLRSSSSCGWRSQTFLVRNWG